MNNASTDLPGGTASSAPPTSHAAVDPAAAADLARAEQDAQADRNRAAGLPHNAPPGSIPGGRLEHSPQVVEDQGKGPLPASPHPLAPKPAADEIREDGAQHFDLVRERIRALWKELEPVKGSAVADLKGKLLELDQWCAEHLHLRFGRAAPPSASVNAAGLASRTDAVAAEARRGIA